MIRLENVTKYYPGSDTPALDGMSLHIRKGEFVFVLGSSGAGKSTFLKLLMREVTADSGRVMVNGFNLKKIRQRKIPYLRRSMGVVFQDFRLIPTMTAYENVAFAMRVTNVPERDVRSRVPFVLGLVGLGDKQDRYPDQLSGGEQQRVALARALVHSPQLIIADEPTGNIDPELSIEIMELLAAINSVGVTVVVVTHEHELVKRFHKRIIHIEHGKVVEDTDPPSENEFDEEIPKGEGLEALSRMNAARAQQTAPADAKKPAEAAETAEAAAEASSDDDAWLPDAKADSRRKKRRGRRAPQEEPPLSAEERPVPPAEEPAPKTEMTAGEAVPPKTPAAAGTPEPEEPAGQPEAPEAAAPVQNKPGSPHATTMADVDELLRQLGGGSEH